MRRLLLLADAIAGVAVLATLIRNRWRRPRSSYLARAACDPSLVADRRSMISHYLEDVRRVRSMSALPPARPSRAVRFVTWNINILCGPDWQTPVHEEDVAKVLESFDADVVVLQEAPVECLDTLWDTALAQPMQRVRRMGDLLHAAGYTTQLRSECENATLLATRLAVAETHAFTLDEHGPTASVNGEEVWVESRGARFAALVPPGDASLPPIACFATHLSHKDRTLVRPAPEAAEPATAEPAAAEPFAPEPVQMRSALHGEWAGASEVGGVRQRQAAVLLRHADAQPAERCAILLADFNAPVCSHYDTTEWRVVAAGLQSAHVNQPLDDGVRRLLTSRSFQCAYEASRADNFGGRPAPALTHWTGTTVDFAYVRGGAWEVAGAYVGYTPLSDHLPVVVDLVSAAA